jgi:NDP-sugar pyrophosphorylase family protein
MPKIALAKYISSFGTSPLATYIESDAWLLTRQSEFVVRSLLASLDLSEFVVTNNIAVHRTAIVDQGAVLKDPLILGPRCFVAAGAYLRGGNWIDEGCIFGPGAELKSSFIFAGTKLAHFNFVGDSILGRDVNLEAGSIVANYRNEREEKEIMVRIGGKLVHTGIQKFGALIGDGSRIGANTVAAPGTILPPHSIVRRAQLIDQEQSSG